MQIESEGMEKYLSYKWMSKEDRVTILTIG